MRIKKVNELNTTEMHPLMGGKLSTEDTMRILSFLSQINNDAKTFKEASDQLGYPFTAYAKGGVLNFIAESESPMTLTVKFDITLKEGDKQPIAPEFKSRTTGYTPERP